jgi:hypothetical protein
MNILNIVKKSEQKKIRLHDAQIVMTKKSQCPVTSK